MSAEGETYERFIEHFLNAAAAGNVDDVQAALKVTDVDASNDKGWTALMFAARNGHLDVTKLLVEKGCNMGKLNNIGQTAQDIALFWQHQELTEFLANPATASSSSPNRLQAPASSAQFTNFLCASPLDRSSQLRTNKSWLESKLRNDASTVFLLFKQLNPFVLNTKGAGARVTRVKYSDALAPLLSDESVVALLGVMTGDDEEETRNAAWFAVDVSDVEDDKLKMLAPDSSAMKTHYQILQLPRSEAAIVGQARSLLAWHDRYRFCPSCGKKTGIREAGYKRQCLDTDCRSNQGVHNTCYPRTDPTVIMAVVSLDRKKVLLGRKPTFPKGFYSCLAGFMEPGENIEEACRREVLEESGVRVGEVVYHSSQPWPMPSSLMIGCIAYALTNDITVDREELEDARWFGVEELQAMLAHRHQLSLFLPPDKAIAHQLILHALGSIAKL